jgi:hypothetical protein
LVEVCDERAYALAAAFISSSRFRSWADGGSWALLLLLSLAAWVGGCRFDGGGAATEARAARDEEEEAAVEA